MTDNKLCYDCFEKGKALLYKRCLLQPKSAFSSQKVHYSIINVKSGHCKVTTNKITTKVLQMESWNGGMPTATFERFLKRLSQEIDFNNVDEN